jgi:hypothetical protein
MLKGFYLTLMIGPVIPVIAPQSVMDAVTSIQVTTSTGQRSGFQITFGLSKDSMLNKILLPVGYFDPKIRVIIIVTVNGSPNVLMDGVITQQSVTPSSEPGQSTLSITGEDLSVLMDLEEKVECFPCLPAEARVAMNLLNYAVYGIVPLIIPSAMVDVPNPTLEIPEQIGTDLQYIQGLAAKVGYVFYIIPGPAPGMNIAYWGPDVRIGLPQRSLKINMDAETNVESLNFTYDGLAKEQLEITIQEPITKLNITLPVPDIGILRPPLALKPAFPLRKRPLGRQQGTAKLNPVRALLLGLSETARASDSVTGSGTLDVIRYGRVLEARRLVSVRGAGLAYDGLYYVKSVTHNIKRGEYKQNFTIVRDGTIPLSVVIP